MKKRIIFIVPVLIITLTGCSANTEKQKIIDAETEILCYSYENNIDFAKYGMDAKNGIITKKEAADKIAQAKEDFSIIAKKYGFESWSDLEEKYRLLHRNDAKLIDQLSKQVKKQVKNTCDFDLKNYDY